MYTANLLLYTHTHIHILFQILFHYWLLKDTEYSFQYYTVGPCCLPVLHIVVCTCWSQTSNLSLPSPSTTPSGNLSLFSLSLSLFLFCICIISRYRNISRYICHIAIYLSLTGLLNTIISRPIHVPHRLYYFIRFYGWIIVRYGLPWCLTGKQSTCQCRRCGFDPCVGKILWTRKWQPTLIFLPRKSHGQRGLAGHSRWGHKRVGHT